MYRSAALTHGLCHPWCHLTAMLQPGSRTVRHGPAAGGGLEEYPKVSNISILGYLSLRISQSQVYLSLRFMDLRVMDTGLRFMDTGLRFMYTWLHAYLSVLPNVWLAAARPTGVYSCSVRTRSVDPGNDLCNSSKRPLVDHQLTVSRWVSVYR